MNKLANSTLLVLIVTQYDAAVRTVSKRRQLQTTKISTEAQRG
jgi:hypothetical protein